MQAEIEQMKTCHICEQIVKAVRSSTCSKCRRTFCFPCIIKQFPEHGEVLPTTATQPLKPLTTQTCFYCLKQCNCYKCSTREAVVAYPSQANQQDKNTGPAKEDDPMQESKLFAGKKVSELPDYLTRKYGKKKTIYSKHQLSQMRHQNMTPDPDEEQQDGTSNKEEKKGMSVEEGQPGQSEMGGPPPESQVNRMDPQNEQNYEAEAEEDDDSGSDRSSPEAVQSRGDIEGDDEGEQMADENEDRSSDEPQSERPQASQSEARSQNRVISISGQEQEKSGSSVVQQGNKEGGQE